MRSKVVQVTTDVLIAGGGKRVAYARYPDECWYCGSCRQDCPEGAIAIVFPPSMVLV